MPIIDPSFLLFVPGDRPDRFAKAAASDASGIVLDLEDAVTVEHKETARDAVARYLDEHDDPTRTLVRVNAPNTPWFNEDLTLLRTRRVGALMIPKIAHASVLNTLASTLDRIEVIALIESAQGVLHAEEIAAHPCCIALAFGPFDLAADLGSSADWDVMLPYRSRVLLAARAHRKYALDGPSLSFTEPVHVEMETRPVVRLGYDGKLLIHPAQIAPVRKAFTPGEEQVRHALRILEAGKHAIPAVLDGMMIDEPLLIAARRTLDRAHVYKP